MRNVFIVLTLLLVIGEIVAQSESKAQVDTIWCIQVLSTRNPHLLKPEMVSAFPDTAMVEESGGWYRILFLYSDREQADIYLFSWQRQHKAAFISTRTKPETKKMYPLFSTL